LGNKKRSSAVAGKERYGAATTLRLSLKDLDKQFKRTGF
jgi:hypothetical protein